MKTQNSLIMEDYQFETLQKTNQNKRIEDNKKFNLSNMRRRQSCLATANKFVTGLVNELKESIAIDDYDFDIFKEQSNQNKPKLPSKRMSVFNNFNFRNKKFKINPINKNSGNSFKKTMTINKNKESNSQLSKRKSFMKDSGFKKINSLKVTSKKVNSTNNLVKKSSLKQEKISNNLKRFSKIPSVKNILFIEQNEKQSPKNSQIQNKSVKFLQLPEKKKKKSNEYRRWSENVNKNNNDLFTFFMKPEYFNDINNDDNINIRRKSHKDKSNIKLDIDDENEKLFQKKGISNKNILELNNLTNDLKKSLILTPKNKIDAMKKTLIGEQLDFKIFEELQLSEDMNLSDHENESDIELKKEELEKYREIQKKGLVYDSLDDYIEQEVSKFCIKPYSRFLLVLHSLVFICTIYNLIAYPLYLGINETYCRSGSFWNIPNVIELFIDFVFFCDFFLQNFIGFYDSDDILYTTIYAIFVNNLRRWFFIDLMCAIPFKTLLIIYDTKCHDSAFLRSYRYSHNFYYLLILIRLIKIFKILHDNKFINYMDEVLDKYEHYNSYFSFYKGMAVSFITINLVSCVLLFLGKNDYPSWIVNFGFEEEGFFKLYFLCVYYIITTITTVGYGDLSCVTVPEKMYGIIIEFGGIIAYSYVVSSISNYVKSKSDQEEEYFNKYQILTRIRKRYPNLSNDLFERINRYIKHKQNNEDQEKNLIEELPISLKNILVYNMYEPIIKNFIFFKNFDNKDFIVRVLFSFKPILSIKNDVLIKNGDFIEDIIFVKRGKVSLELPIRIDDDQTETRDATMTQNTSTFNQTNTSNQPNQTKTMGNLLGTNDTDFFEEEPEHIYQNFKILDIRKNEHFGDVLMFSNERSPLCAIVKSRKAELFFLKKSDAIEISQSYPQIWQKILKKSSFNMAQIRKLMAKVIKIFHTLNGIIQNEQTNESSSLSPVVDSRLESIPSITESNNTVVDQKKETFTTSINNLNTIKESAIISEEDSYSSSKNKEKKENENSKKEEMSTIKNNNEESDSSCFTQRSYSKKSKFSKKSKKSGNPEINETCRVTHLSNKKFEFSEKYLSDDLEKQFLISQGSNYTPFKPEEINNEIYPNENFMKYSSSNNNVYKILNRNNNKSDISICSTEVSFSIQSKYENIDELSGYRYSKTPKLRNKVKSLLKSHDIDSEENSIIVTKIKNKTFKKSFLYSDNFSSEKQNTMEIKKYVYDESVDKKKKSNNNKNKTKFNLETINISTTSTQQLRHISDKNVNSINKNLTKENKTTDNNSFSFTNFFQNFIDKEINKSKNETTDNSQELAKKMEKLEKLKKNLSTQNQG